MDCLLFVGLVYLVIHAFPVVLIQVNLLEQICVNLCSETLQHFYNTHVFKSTDEYTR